MKDLIKLGNLISPYVVGAEGNISKKHNDLFFIKASGVSCNNLIKENIIKCNLQGKQLNNFNKKPSMEIGFHAWLLSLPSVKYIAHTHPTNTLKILCTNYLSEFSQKRLFPDQIIYNGPTSCIVPYANPGNDLTKLIKTNVSDYITLTNQIPKLILLQNHGIICIGTSYQQCVIATEICEKAAEIFLGAKFLSNINYLNDSDIEFLEKDKNEIYRKNICHESNIC
jgi:ribulose-5-phosphate 4-epimerase/fuculose-1-phosphate aldolase